MFALRRALPGALLLATLVACGDSTAPKAPEHLPLETADISLMATRVDSVFEQPILSMLRGGAAPLAAPPAVRASLVLAGTRPSTAPQLRAALSAERATIARLVAPGEPVVPTLVRGVTFVWNGAQYVPDTLANGLPRPGAPSNGVRFMLYATSDETGLPTGPALGFLEVVDNSTSTSARWTSRVVTSAGLTVLQATNAVSSSIAGFTVSQTGFITDGTRRIEQSLTLGATGIRATWSAPFAGVSMELRVQQTSETSGSMSWSLTTPQGSLRVVLTSTADGAGSAQIYVNGGLWARQSWTVDGEVSDYAWQKADGSGPITEAEAATVVEALGFIGALASLDDFETTISELIYGASAS